MNKRNRLILLLVLLLINLLEIAKSQSDPPATTNDRILRTNITTTRTTTIIKNGVPKTTTTTQSTSSSSTLDSGPDSGKSLNLDIFPAKSTSTSILIEPITGNLSLNKEHDNINLNDELEWTADRSKQKLWAERIKKAKSKCIECDPIGTLAQSLLASQSYCQQFHSKANNSTGGSKSSNESLSNDTSMKTNEIENSSSFFTITQTITRYNRPNLRESSPNLTSITATSENSQIGENQAPYLPQCECKVGFGGQLCNECPTGQFGNAHKNTCRPCLCHRDGSSSQNCNVTSGKCNCMTGVSGDRCDQCARGYVGKFPTCTWCGECFDYWDAIIGKLRNDTAKLLARVRLLLDIGTPGAYGKEYAEIEAKLDRIEAIVNGQRLDPDAIAKLALQIQQLTARLKEIEKQLEKNERDADSIARRTQAVLQALNDIGHVIEELSIMADQLRENATQLQETNVDGAYAIILAAQNKSREAEKAVRNLRPLLLESEQKRRATENMLASATSRYNSTTANNEAILSAMAKQISQLESGVVPINQHVCASNATVNQCDSLCGGSLCEKCGGLSCADGATTRATNALEMAKQADDLIRQKYDAALAQLAGFGEARNISHEALNKSRLAMTLCEQSKEKFSSVAADMNAFIDAVDKFIGIEGARPAEVRVYGTECLALKIGLKPEQILDLARQINETIASLTDIDRILQETSGDLNTAQELHSRADHAKEMADNILDMAKQVLEMLKQAAIEQAKALSAIEAATGDVDGARADLAEISTELEKWEKFIHDLTAAVHALRDRLDEILKKFAQNELFVGQASSAANDAGKLTDQAAALTDEVAMKVALFEEKMRQKARQSGEAKDRAERLKNEALSLGAETLSRLGLLRELDDAFDEYARRLKDWQDIIDDLHRQMDQYIKDIDAKAQYYRECQS